jgi:formylglycine-generating enzyme required for sulfatase activity
MSSVHQKKWQLLVCGAVAALAAVMLAPPGQGFNMVRGDLNGDGIVNAVDEVLMANYLSGNLRHLSLAGDVCETWLTVGDMIFVPPGTFTQGSPEDEPCRATFGSGVELQFTHTLTRTIAVMPTEVTQGMWSNLRTYQPTLPVDPSDITYGSGSTHAVQNLTWSEAILFSNLLSVQRGLDRCYFTDPSFTLPVTSSNYTTYPLYCDFDADGFRLPTEGEWEYFCRAGTTTPFSVTEYQYIESFCDWCDPYTMKTLESVAVFCADDPPSAIPVAYKKPNPWNLYDVHGHVSEWCWDVYDWYPTGSAIDYSLNTSNVSRVYRGGSRTSDPSGCRSAFRDHGDYSVRLNTRGFRLVRTLE